MKYFTNGRHAKKRFFWNRAAPQDAAIRGGGRGDRGWRAPGSPPATLISFKLRERDEDKLLPGTLEIALKIGRV